MQAVVTHGLGEASVEERPRPEPAADEVLVQVNRVQMSVTECWMYDGTLGFSDDLRARIDDGGALAFGHEFAGEVVEVGEGVEEFAVGDRVYAPGKITCGACPYCAAGVPLLCKDKETLGMGWSAGALAEYFATPTEPLRALPDGVSDAEGAALQPLSAAVVAMRDAAVAAGDVVAVVGAGVMGANCGQLAREDGASETFAVDVDPEKAALADDLGLTGIDANEVDPIERIQDETGGVGADVAVEAVGGAQAHATDGDGPLAQAAAMARKRGTVLQVGILTDELRLDPRALRGRAIDLVNPTDGVEPMGPNTDTGEYAARLVADGRVSVAEFVTHELEGLEAFHEAVEITTNKAEHGALGPAQILV